MFNPVSPFYARTLATDEAKPALHTFIVWAPDYTDDDAFNRRMAVRGQHMVKAMESAKDGMFTRIIGPYLTPESIATPDAPKKILGSMLLVRAASIEEVRARVEEDLYWTANVWDKEKIVIAPYMTSLVWGHDTVP
ncbi:hypothetical protein CPB86DRAFT_703313 [Serendipita vermifera]|nr:hypothetical protein CPB86DRAFT_703313 [Serendipita vermifera]